MSRGFVICAFCGARIRADRGRCLRCGEALQAAAAPEPTPTLGEWLQTSNPRNLAIGAVASLVVLVGVVVFMDTGSGPTPAARPATSASKSKPLVAAPAARPAQPDGLLLPPTASDSVRLGGVAFNAGDFVSAKIRYQQALQKKADDPEALNGLGLVLEREGQFDQAVAQFTRAAAVAPTTWACRFNLAHALGEIGRWDEAVDEYRVASGLFPDDYATQYNLAQAMHKKGDDAAAIPEFEKAIALAPREPSFHLSLAMSLEKTGRIADAVREYQQYLDMAPWTPEAEQLKAHLKAMGSSLRPGV